MRGAAMPDRDTGYGDPDARRQLVGPLPSHPSAHRVSPWLADLKPFKPYRYRGLGYDIYLDNEEDSDGDS
jgi:hypothetical protein